MIVISHAKFQINVPSSEKENPDRKKKKNKKNPGVPKPQKSNFFSANLLGEFAKTGHII